MIGEAGEIVLPRRVKLQPTPDLHQGGDCGACVLGGIFDMTVQQVYDELKGDVKSIHYGEMQRVLRVSVYQKRADRIIEEPAAWPRRWWGCDSFGRPSHMESLPWFNYVRAFIDAGYYGIASVDSDKQGGSKGGTDHWVMICGARTEGSVNGKVITGDVLVSCSMRRTGMVDEWVEAREFLQHRGGYDILFARPKNR